MKKRVSLILISILIFSLLATYVFAQGNICCATGLGMQWRETKEECESGGGKVACIRGYSVSKKGLWWYDYGVCGDASTTGPAGQGSQGGPQGCGFVLQTEKYKWGGYFSGGSPPVGIPELRDPSWTDLVPKNEEGLTTAMTSCISPSDKQEFLEVMNAVVSNPRDTASASKAINMLQKETENRQAAIYELVAREAGIETMNMLPNGEVKDTFNEFYNARITGQEITKPGFRSVGACEVQPTNPYSACWPGLGGQYVSESTQLDAPLLVDHNGNPVDLSAEIAKAESGFVATPRAVTQPIPIAPVAPSAPSFVAPAPYRGYTAPQQPVAPVVPTPPVYQQRRGFYIPFFSDILGRVVYGADYQYRR